MADDDGLLGHVVTSAFGPVVGQPVAWVEGLFVAVRQRAVLPIPALEAPLASLSEGAGLPLPLVKFAVAMYASYLFAIPNRMLPGAGARHAWAILGGVFLLQFTFGGAWLHLALTSTLVYAFTAATLHVPAANAWRHWVAAIFSFAYLTVMHFLRLWTVVEATSMDYVVVHMVSIIKLYTLCYNLYDGVVGAQHDAAAADKARADLAAAPGGSKAADKAKATLAHLKERAARALPALPSLLEFYGFMFNFTTVFVGPGFEISEYLRAQRRANADIPMASRAGPALFKAAVATACVVASQLLARAFPVDAIYTDAVAGELSIPAQVAKAHFALMAVRAGYYFVWRLAEGACIWAGYGYDERRDGTLARWDGVLNVKIWEVESSTSMAATMKDWNRHTQSWLELYIFRRAPRLHELNRWLTFAASAFWHGLFPGYYLGFVSVPLLATASRNFYAALRPIVAPVPYDRTRLEYRAYTVVKWVITYAAFDYSLVVFALYDWHRASTVWHAWHYFGHIGGALLFLVAAVTARAKKAARAPAPAAPTKKAL